MPARRFAPGSGTLQPLLARIGERDQVAGQVAAVHRWRHSADPAAADPACRTSCRNGRGSARACAMVASVASSRSTASFVPIQPKSRALDRRQEVKAEIGRRGPVREDRRRVFLEVVRRQHVDRPASRRSRRTARCGVRSGAGAPRVVSRHRQAARAGGETGSPSARRRARQSTAAANGHRHRPGACATAPRPTTTARNANDDRTGHPRDKSRRRSSRGPSAAWAAVIHSSRCRRVTNNRISVRTIASPINHAWCARNVDHERGLSEREAQIVRRARQGGCAA